MNYRLVASALALMLALASAAPAVAAEPMLSSVHTAALEDGSTRITLTFTGGTPVARLVHNAANLVHVIFFGAGIEPKVLTSVAAGGSIRGGSLNDFAGIGFRLDLALHGDVAVRLESDPEEHTIVVHIPALHSDVESTIDTTISANGMQTVYVPLSYADVSEVAGILVKDASVNSLDGFTPQSPFAAPTPNPNSSSSMGGANTKAPTYVTIPTANIMTKDVPRAKRLDEHVAIDRRLNAVILTGTPDQIADYKKIISFVDVPEPGILIEAEIVELTENAAKDLGIDFSSGGALATASSTLRSTGVASSTIALNATINALSQTGAAKILARPRILTLNGQTAAILSGEAVPIVNTVLTPSGGGTIIENQVQYINVGISLQVLPRVAADGHVTTQVFTEVSSIIDYVGTAPRIAVRQALTSGIVADGESLLVGGLMQQTEISTLSKVPGLGDIPLIGGFFRNNSTSSQTTNLYLVLTPHVLATKTHPPKP
jgi:type II secretory pathway component GspD/PulD (secretin)